MEGTPPPPLWPMRTCIHTHTGTHTSSISFSLPRIPPLHRGCVALTKSPQAPLPVVLTLLSGSLRWACKAAPVLLLWCSPCPCCCVWFLLQPLCVSISWVYRTQGLDLGWERVFQSKYLDLQCFSCTAKWFSDMCVYMYMHIPFWNSFSLYTFLKFFSIYVMQCWL